MHASIPPDRAACNVMILELKSQAFGMSLSLGPSRSPADKSTVPRLIWAALVLLAYDSAKRRTLQPGLRELYEIRRGYFSFALNILTMMIFSHLHKP